MSAYSVKEIFYSLQGEGDRSGRPSVFLRFAGCNFWTGREEDRKDAICNFCDTDFVGTNGTFGGKYASASELAEVIESHWPDRVNRYVVCTGGEPLLQLDEDLIKELQKREFEVAVETNGSIAVPEGLDWICVSPKQSVEKLIQKTGDELKFIFPQAHIHPEEFEHLSFNHFCLQPMDNNFLQNNIQLCLNYCLANPKWKLSLQTHKILQIR